jgi:hypothetical protein
MTTHGNTGKDASKREAEKGGQGGGKSSASSEGANGERDGGRSRDRDDSDPNSRSKPGRSGSESGR